MVPLLILILQLGLASAILQLHTWWKLKHGKKSRKGQEKAGQKPSERGKKNRSRSCPKDQGASPHRARRLWRRIRNWGRANPDTSAMELLSLPAVVNCVVYEGPRHSTMNSPSSSSTSSMDAVSLDSFQQPLPILMARLAELAEANNSENSQPDKGVKEPVVKPRAARDQDGPQDLVAGTKRKCVPRCGEDRAQRPVLFEERSARERRPEVRACDQRGQEPKVMGQRLEMQASTETSTMEFPLLPAVMDSLIYYGSRDLARPPTRKNSSVFVDSLSQKPVLTEKAAETKISKDPQSNKDVKGLVAQSGPPLVQGCPLEQVAGKKHKKIPRREVDSAQKVQRPCKVGQCLQKCFTRFWSCLKSCLKCACQISCIHFRCLKCCRKKNSDPSS